MTDSPPEQPCTLVINPEVYFPNGACSTSSSTQQTIVPHVPDEPEVPCGTDEPPTPLPHLPCVVATVATVKIDTPDVQIHCNLQVVHLWYLMRLVLKNSGSLWEITWNMSLMGHPLLSRP